MPQLSRVAVDSPVGARRHLLRRQGFYLNRGGPAQKTQTSPPRNDEEAERGWQELLGSSQQSREVESVLVEGDVARRC